MRPSRQPISRRAFLGGSAAAGLAAAGWCAANTTLAPTADSFLDDHVHLTHPWYGREHGPITASALLDWMDSSGIARAFVLPLVSPEAFWYPITTDFVLKETARHRDRLLPFCAIDPRTLVTHLTSRREVVDMLNRYIDAGAIGFGEHKCRLPMADPLNMQLYEACAEARLPVLFHLDNKSLMDEPGLPGLEKVLKTFPDLVMIGHAKGWWASIAGNLTQDDLHVGYPKGPVAPGGAVDRLMEKYPNLYGDLSSGGAWAMLRDPQFGREFLLRRSDRLLWGTDWYDLAQRGFQQFDLFTRFELPQGVSAKIAHGNAERLFNLSTGVRS
jgi:predicted TIM-barrel fold metal-dependent hydrolase